MNNSSLGRLNGSSYNRDDSGDAWADFLAANVDPIHGFFFPDHYYQKVSTMGIVGRIRMIDARKSLARRAPYCPGTGRSQARVEMRGAYSSRRD
jgi:hypothetical protein